MTTFINPSPTGGSNYMAYAPTVEKLKGIEDYEEWAVKARMNLEMLEIDSWIDEGNTKPLEGDQEIVAWTKGNMSAKAYLINCITGDVLKRIQRAGWTTKHTAYETWVYIRKTVSIAVEDALHDLMTTFFKLDRAQFASLDAFLEKLHYMWKHIKSRLEMPDEVFVTVALNGIRKTNEVWYNNWIHDMEKGMKITKSDISSFLSRHANTEKQQKSSNFSTTTKKADNTTASASKPATSKQADKDDLCYKCPATKSGWRHTIPECWVDHPEKKAEFYERKRKRQEQRQQQGNADITTAGANFMGMTVRRQVTWALEVEEITRNDSPALTTTESVFQDDIIVDSGCSNHCFNDKKWFTFMTDILDEEMMTTSNGGDLRVLGQGTVRVITAEGSITLLEVYYCPDGAANMLSPGVLKRRGIVIDGYNDILAVKKTKQKVCDIFWRHGIAVLRCEKPINPYNFAALPKNMTSSRVEYGLMHRRLVHAGQTRVLTACKKAGIDIDPATIQGYHCEACQLAKADAMISRAPLVTTNTFLAYVFWDIIETTPVGYGGYRYSLHSIDAATGFHWIIFLHTRDEAFPKLRDWKEAIERMSAGYKIQVLAFDNAREFTSKKMRKWAAKEGITARWSTPYTPEQNGRVERAGRALVEAVRSVCIETNLPQELWPLYMEASVYINNRLPTSSNRNNDSPIEKMFRMINVPYEPYLKHIRTWGCTAYVRTPEERRIRSQKMATRAKKGMLVGLQGMRGHIYKIWLPDEQKVIRARDVRFWEQYPDRRNDPEVPDLEAILIDPEFTDDGRVLLVNPPVTAPMKEVTGNTQQSAEREKETPRDSEKEAEIQEKGNEAGNGNEGSHHETPRLLTPSPSLSPQRRQQEEEEVDVLLLERPFQMTEHDLSDALDYGITGQLEERPEILEEPVSDCIIVHDPEVITASRKRQPKPPPPPSDRTIRKTVRADYKKLHNGFTLLASAYREQDEFGPQELHYVFTTLRATQETTEDVKTVPKTWKQAVKRDDYHDVWKPAEERQIRSLEEKGVWDLVELPQGAHALDGKWVYDMKYPEGKEPYARARWVVRGDQEREDYTVSELYTAVAHIASVRLFYALVAILDYKTAQADVTTAFLNAKARKVIYVRQPHNYEDGTGRVCRLNRALYGLPISPAWWFETATEELTALGFTPLFTETCIFRRDDGVLLILYVDDMIVAAATKKQVEAVMREIDQKFEIKQLGEMKEFLGLQISRDRENRHIFIHQAKFIEKMITKFSDGTLKPAKTPWPQKLEIPSDWRDEKPVMLQTEWLQRTGSSNYLSMGTRPDITFTSQKLSEANSGPSGHHEKVFKHLLRYLSGTTTLALILGGKYNIYDLKPRVYADASFADDRETRCSSAGHIVFVGDGPIFWKSKKQTIVATSSTEAEFMNLTPAGMSLLWITQVLREAGYEQPTPWVLYTDSQNARLAVLNKRNAARTRHIDIRFKWVIQKTEEGYFDLRQVRTDEMITDGLTKALGAINHEKFLIQLRLRSL